MAERTLYQCDGCDKTTLDFYLTTGWLRIESTAGLEMVRLTLSGGRRKDRQARTRFLSSRDALLFCSPRCLVASLSPFPEASA